jgi:glycine/D-amino acid oxidase-like deaminating enzyme
LPALDRDATADVCVVGLGGSGLSAISELLVLGRTVVGVDAGSVAGAAAGRNGGILRAGASLSYHDAVAALGHDRARRLYALTAGEIDRMERETPGAVRRTGSLRVAADDAEWTDCLRQLDALRGDGIDAVEQDGPFGRGVFVARNASLQPVTRARTLAQRAMRSGAILFEHSAAISFSGNEVVTQRGRVRCGAVIVAVDGGLEDLVPSLTGIARTTRLQMLGTAPDPDLRIPCPVSMNRGYDYCQQLPDGRIILGGGRDRAMDREWGAPGDPSGEIQDYLDGVLRRRIGSRAEVTHRWAARVAYTPDGLPVFGEREPNLWVTGAYSGTGNLLGALSGRAAAQHAAGSPTPESAELARLLAEPAAARAC